MHWLFESRKRFDLTILNFMCTSNHIHLLVEDGLEKSVIAESMQLLAGRTAQEYNQRKDRSGGFWEDRYHATAIESGKHLARCMAYIDMNMVRAGVVSHPREWLWCGYQEIQNGRSRYRLIDTTRTAQLLELGGVCGLATAQQQWVEEALSKYHAKRGFRQPEWSEGLAVGSQSFSEKVKERLGLRATHRTCSETNGHTVLREQPDPYSPHSGVKNARLNRQNAHLWKLTN